MLDKCNNYLCRAGQALTILTHDNLWYTPLFPLGRPFGCLFCNLCATNRTDCNPVF